MAIIKCKMCGGDIQLAEDKTFGTCEYCGCTMTFPKVSDEQRAAAFNRGNHFRRIGEFDKALAVYERIVAEDDADAEAHWCCALCRFGIEYVEDPATYEWLPTCHRASFDSFLEDVDYLAAVEHSDGITRRQYQKDAAKIAEVQRGILATSQNTDPYDVFISYKELDDKGERTRDSILAQEIYYRLTEKGWRVFFSRISLEDVPGTQYEPYIFAALNSAKVMIVVGTSAENLNAVWVKNEWSRYLSLMRKDRGKLLIPCYRDMDPYDLPEQLSVLMSYDMGKIGFIQDLIRGVDKVLNAEKPKELIKEAVKETSIVESTTKVAPLLKRAFMFLEDGEWSKADDYCEQVLNQEPENAQAYLGKLMAELHVCSQAALTDCEQPFDLSNNYQKAVRFGDDALSSALRGYVNHINERNENNRLNSIYSQAVSAMESAKNEEDYKSAAASFKLIPDYKDADALAAQCLENAEVARKDTIYASAKALMTGNRIASYESAIKGLSTIHGWKDSAELINVCQRRIEEIKIEQAEYQKTAKKKRKRNIAIAIPIILACVAFAFVLVKVIIPRQKLNNAFSMLESGDYEAAYALLEELGNSEAIVSNKYERALALMKVGNYDSALILLDGLNYMDSEEQIENCYIGKLGKEQYQYIKDLKAGDIYIFGSYEQDNKTTNGAEEIEWIVLEKDGMSLLLISKYALDARSFGASTWSSCSLRRWLNYTFLTTAFTKKEQAMIQSVTVSADKNPKYSTSPGNSTTDQVFLLSIPEVSQYFSYAIPSKCIPTAYALAQGVQTFSEKLDGEATCWWWLRSPGTTDRAAFVSSDGSIYYYGDVTGKDSGAVRPAIWVDLWS